MKSKTIEVWGVKLGLVHWCMDGWLVLRSGSLKPTEQRFEWYEHWINPRFILEGDLDRAYGVSNGSF